MKRTRKQIKNIKNGCVHRDNTAIIDAQKRRHLKARINKLIIKALSEEKNIDTCKNWIDKVERIQTEIALKLLLEEITRETTC